MSLHILFLAVRMRPGFGVSVVIEQLARRLLERGVTVTIGCLEREGAFPGLDIQEVAASAEAINALVAQVSASHVIAHTSPYFEMLPGVVGASTWAWEHGDPDPEFFRADQAERQHQCERKRTAVYPTVDGVIAISHFICEQIRWPAARVICNGWEHVLTAEQAAINPWEPGEGVFRVGCLIRLGKGEELYKGGDLFLELARLVKNQGWNWRFGLMGRGSEADARPYRQAGFEVFPNASDAQRAGFLQGADVFVSPSLWEGCNLPLLEAQAMGTASIAFDTGAHPEFANTLVSSVAEAARVLLAWNANTPLLAQAGLEAQQRIRRQYSWDLATDECLQLIL